MSESQSPSVLPPSLPLWAIVWMQLPSKLIVKAYMNGLVLNRSICPEGWMVWDEEWKGRASVVASQQASRPKLKLREVPLIVPISKLKPINRPDSEGVYRLDSDIPPEWFSRCPVE